MIGVFPMFLYNIRNMLPINYNFIGIAEGEERYGSIEI